MDVRRNLCAERAVKHCHGLPREAVGSASLEVLNNRLEVVLRAVI